VVLASGNYPFSTCDTETCRYAVLVVDMSYVRLETSSGLIVPQTNSTVMCCGEDVFRVRRKLNLLTDKHASDIKEKGV